MRAWHAALVLALAGCAAPAARPAPAAAAPAAEPSDDELVAESLIDLSITDASPRTVLQLLAAYQGCNVVLPPPGFLVGDISHVRLRDVRAREAFDAIAARVGCQVVRVDDTLIVVVYLLVGRLAGSDDEVVTLRLDATGALVHAPLPPPSSPAREAVLAALRSARDGDRLALRCDWQDGAMRISGVASPPD